MLDQSHEAPLLSVRDLSVVADLASGPRSIVDRVSFDLRPRQILAVIGDISQIVERLERPAEQ